MKNELLESRQFKGERVNSGRLGDRSLVDHLLYKILSNSNNRAFYFISFDRSCPIGIKLYSGGEC